MRINDANLTGSAAEAARASETQRPEHAQGRAGSTAASSSGDRVELSSSLGALSKVLSAFGSDRAARVQTLAAEYQSGQYRPDAMGASRGLVTEALAAGNG